MTAMILCKTCGWGWPGTCPHACVHPEHACHGPFAQGIAGGTVTWGHEMVTVDVGTGEGEEDQEDW